MSLLISARQLVEEANCLIDTLSLEEADARRSDSGVQFVDIRDVRELEREGMIPGAFHAPRGMLEFWIDPESPYFKPVFAEEKLFVFYCQSGWRSALATATVQRMGLDNVCHIEGGFNAWKKAGLDIKPKQ
ncbi:MAG: rhodanese-like domain-containing protein [Candidatus Pelagadaptatus aseana]|uniref:rhodanese-like domain-containing protein n=1 Tax=Candidatus Pelagadaptatus aseana TaxID=3120508 RepID=UPI0039B3237D